MKRALTILLDIDGVIADTLRELCEYFNVDLKDLERREKPLSPHFEDLLGVDRKKIDDISAEFWASVRLMPWAYELVDLFKFVFGIDNVVFCTSPGRLDPSSNFFKNITRGKEIWVSRNFPEFRTRVVFCYCKWYLASPKHILVDDREDQISPFIKNGGYGILFPAIYNSKYRFSKDPMSYMYSKIEMVSRKLLS